MYYDNFDYKKILTRTIVEDFPIDYDTFFSIMYQQAPTHSPTHLKAKKKFLIKLFKKHTGIKATEDKMGNLYFVKGETSDVLSFYPTIVAHYDTAQEFHLGLQIMRTSDWIFGFDNTTGTQCGIGADDSVGVYFALEMLKKLPICKVAIFNLEESGCIGSKSADMEFFKDSSLVTQLDRRSFSNDFITYTNGCTVFPKNHLEVITPLLKKYNYKEETGSCTDVGQLRKNGLSVASHNLACGYFNEHTDEEIIHIPSMINAMSLAMEIHLKLLAENLQLDFPYTQPVYTTNNYFSNKPTWGNSVHTNPFDNFSDLGNGEYSDFDAYLDNGLSYNLRKELADNWNFINSEDVEYEIYNHTGITEEDAENLSFNILSTKNQLFAYVGYRKKPSIVVHPTKKQLVEVTLDKRTIKEKLISGSLFTNGCCSKKTLDYYIESNVLQCSKCSSTYYYPFDAEDMLELPEDNSSSIQDFANRNYY